MGNDWERERRSLQEGLAARTVTLDVLEETYQQAVSLARDNGWSEAEALLIIFANGLAYLRGQEKAATIERADLSEQVLAELNKTLRQLMQESSRYASLKFKAYRMSQDNQALEMHESSLMVENAMLRSRLEQFREDEERLKARVEELQAELEALRRQPEEPSSDGAAPARPRSMPLISGAAWKVDRPRLRADEDNGPHTWAEHLLPKLPFRFQKYVEELLFDDERILYFLHRPAFRPKTGKAASLLRRRQEREGLLVVTDRMLLFMADATAADSTLVHWGYRAALTAVERLADARVVETAAGATLGVRTRAGEQLAFAVPTSHARPLREVAALLTRFSHSRRLLPCRVYGAAPAWEPPDVRRDLRALRGREIGQTPEPENASIRATGPGAAVTVQDGSLICEDKARACRVPVVQVSSVELLRALMGCRFTARFLDARRLREWTTDFEYPQSTDFLRVTSRLRHLMGQSAPPVATPGLGEEISHVGSP